MILSVPCVDSGCGVRVQSKISVNFCTSYPRILTFRLLRTRFLVQTSITTFLLDPPALLQMSFLCWGSIQGARGHMATGRMMRAVQGSLLR